MARSRLVSIASSLSLVLGACSATHLNIVDEAGPSTIDAGVAAGTDVGPIAFADAFVPPGVDAGPPDPTAPDASSPPIAVDAWSPPIGAPDASSPPIAVDAWSPPIGAPDAWSPPASDAGPPGVTCGTDVCTAPEICCVTFSGGPGGGGMSTMTCGAAADCMGLAASCDGPEDCAAGEACCGMRSTGGGSTGCVPDAMCRFGRLCHADSDCSGRDTCCSFMGAYLKNAKA
jgi:hypothetical protein